MEEKIREILARYPFEIQKLYRGRGVYLCETEHGIKLIREYQGSPSRLTLEAMVKSGLREKGFVYIDMFVANDEGNYITEDDEGKRYVVTDWYEGRECSTRDREEMQTAAANLASMHQKMCRVSQDKSLIGPVSQDNLYLEMERRRKELNRIKNYIMKRKQKNEFDRCFMEAFGESEKEAKEALRVLCDAGYTELFNEAVLGQTFCHGEFTQHNILFTKRQVAVVRFDKIHVDIQIKDLYLFLRKMMEKNHWNINLGDGIIRAYNKVRPLRERDIRCLYAMLLFPEKFWKTGNRYVNTRKSWLSSRNMEKLEKLTRTMDERNRFLAYLDKISKEFV